MAELVNIDLRLLVEEKNREINELKAKMKIWIDNDLSFVSEVEAECARLKEDLALLERENSLLKTTNDTLRTELKGRSLNEHQFIDMFENDIRNLKALISSSDLSITTQAVEKQLILREKSFISELQMELRCLKERLEFFEIGTTTIATLSTATDLHQEIASLRSQLEAEQKHSQEVQLSYSSVCDQNSILKEALLIKELTIQKNLKVEILELEEFRSFLKGISFSTNIVTSANSSSGHAKEAQLHYANQANFFSTVKDVQERSEGASAAVSIFSHGGAIYSSDETANNDLGAVISLDRAGILVY